jgi:DNA-binding MarR family transcriptional regulator
MGKSRAGTEANETADETVVRVGDRYRDNFSRDLLALARYFQRNMMAALQQQCGHDRLRLGYAAYISLLGAQDMRLSELAEAIGVSRQACNQSVRQIEAAGYISSHPDPSDGRARRLRLSPRGRKLLSDGIRIAAQLDERFRDIIGEQAFDDTGRSLRLLQRELLLAPGDGWQPGPQEVALGGLLPRLSDYVFQRLMQLTIERGHPGLKLSFGQVLMFVGPDGGRIQHMAAVHDVSKQAISAIATELEQLGYLERRPDPQDARQILLYLTPRGRQLIADSVASLEEMESGFRDILGKRRFQRLTRACRALNSELPLGGDFQAPDTASDIRQLAQQLRHQLGADASRQLARLLLN